MTWLLILVFCGQCEVAQIETIEFTTKEACEAAIVQFENRRTLYGANKLCVRR